MWKFIIPLNLLIQKYSYDNNEILGLWLFRSGRRTWILFVVPSCPWLFCCDSNVKWSIDNRRCAMLEWKVRCVFVRARSRAKCTCRPSFARMHQVRGTACGFALAFTTETKHGSEALGWIAWKAVAAGVVECHHGGWCAHKTMGLCAGARASRGGQIVNSHYHAGGRNSSWRDCEFNTCDNRRRQIAGEIHARRVQAKALAPIYSNPIFGVQNTPACIWNVIQTEILPGVVETFLSQGFFTEIRNMHCQGVVSFYAAKYRSVKDGN